MSSSIIQEFLKTCTRSTRDLMHLKSNSVCLFYILVTEMKLKIASQILETSENISLICHHDLYNRKDPNKS